MRYFIEIAYNGKNYCGWQKQPNAIAVQQVLEEKISAILRQEVLLTGAGRTDAGVHAKQLFAHFDFDEINDVSDLIYKLNSFLPNDISVKNILRMNDDAHARFHATEREYQYFISLTKNPFMTDFAYEINKKPDVYSMQQAADFLLGHNDFQCFSRSKTDVKTYYCTVKKASWSEENERLIFTVSADRFLRNMVRAVVGTLLDVGFGKITLEDVKEIISKKDRTNAGASAPAHGLFLNKVIYPENIFQKKEGE